MASATLYAGKHAQDTQLIETVQLWLNSLSIKKHSGKHTQHSSIIQIENNYPKFTTEATNLLEAADELLGLNNNAHLNLKTANLQAVPPESKQHSGKRLQIKEIKILPKINLNWEEKRSMLFQACANISEELKQIHNTASKRRITKMETAYLDFKEKKDLFVKGCSNIIQNLKSKKLKPETKHQVKAIEDAKTKEKPNYLNHLKAKACILLSSVIIISQGTIAVKNYREAKEREALEATQVNAPVQTPEIVNILYGIALENCQTKTMINSYIDTKIDYSALDFSKREPTLEDKLNYIYQEYKLTAHDFQVLVAVVRQEAGNSYQEAYNVISNLLNRIKSKQWARNYPNGQNLMAQLLRPGQYMGYEDNNYLKYMKNYTSLNAFNAVIDCLITQKTSHNYKSFLAASESAPGVQLSPGGNVYRNALTSSDLLSLKVKSFDSYMDEKFYNDLYQQIINLTQENLKDCMSEELQALIDPYIEPLTQEALSNYKSGMSLDEIATRISNIIKSITQNYLYELLDAKTNKDIMHSAANTTRECTKGYMNENMRQNITALYKSIVQNTIASTQMHQNYTQTKNQIIDELRDYCLSNTNETPATIVYNFDLVQDQTRILTPKM